MNVNQIKSNISVLSEELGFGLHIKDEEKTTTLFFDFPKNNEKINMDNVVDSIKVFAPILKFDIVGFGTGPDTWMIVLEFQK